MDDTSLEFLAGPKVWIVNGLNVQAAVGAGLVRGFGTPDFRFVVGMQWAPRTDDADGDGVADEHDDCPLEMEDKDGFADKDGCPDIDNDGDGVLDPDDKCPLRPEDMNGIDDEDGCPDGDRDKDGIADARDKCPSEPEDKDGFQDRDGCPDLDNDQDGILDVADKCSNRPETPNGFQDEDGCPDKKEPVVTIEPEVDCKVTIAERVFFAKGSAGLSGTTIQTLQIVVHRYEKHKDVIATFRFDGHASEEGPKGANLGLSKRRVAAVKAFLVKGGIPPALVKTAAYGEEQPLAAGADESAYAKNRRVELHVELNDKCKGKSR